METTIFKIKKGVITLMCVAFVFFVGGYAALLVVGGRAALQESLYRMLGVIAIVVLIYLNFLIFKVTTIEVTSDRILLKRIWGKTTSYLLADIKQVMPGKRMTHLLILLKSGKSVGYNIGSLERDAASQIAKLVNDRIK